MAGGDHGRATTSQYAEPARKGEAKGLFYFTTYDKLSAETFLPPLSGNGWISEPCPCFPD